LPLPWLPPAPAAMAQGFINILTSGKDEYPPFAESVDLMNNVSSIPRRSRRA
jgi:hypothetical protein